MTDVVALGELLIDFTLTGTDGDGYPSFAANPGGAPGNFLAAGDAGGETPSLTLPTGGILKAPRPHLA